MKSIYLILFLLLLLGVFTYFTYNFLRKKKIMEQFNTSTESVTTTTNIVSKSTNSVSKSTNSVNMNTSSTNSSNTSSTKNGLTFDQWNKDQNQALQNTYDATKSTNTALAQQNLLDINRKKFPYQFRVKPYKIVERPENCPKCPKCPEVAPVMDCSKCFSNKKQYHTYKNKTNQDRESDKDIELKLKKDKEGYKLWF